MGRKPLMQVGEFIKAFNSSKSIAEVCQKTGLKGSQIRNIALRMRNRNVCLKKFKRGCPVTDRKYEATPPPQEHAVVAA